MEGIHSYSISEDVDGDGHGQDIHQSFAIACYMVQSWTNCKTPVGIWRVAQTSERRAGNEYSRNQSEIVFMAVDGG